MDETKKHGHLPEIRLEADRIPRAYHFEVWRESCEMIFDSEPLARDWSFPGDSTIYMVDELLFTHVQFPATLFTRDARHRAHGDSDGLLLQYNRSGRQKGLLENDSQLELGPDRITLQDFAHGYSAISEQTDTYGVLIPRSLIPTSDFIYSKRPVISWDTQSAQGRLLLSALQAIWHDMPAATAEDARPLALGFTGLLNGILSADANLSQHEHIENATFIAMKEYIQANLTRDDLNAELLSHTFQRSRATVYRMFKPLGGVHSYIRDLRLMRCFRELLQNQNAKRGLVRTVAERWGFFDAAHFSSLFKRRYGIRPSDLIGSIGEAPVVQALDDTPEPLTALIGTLRNWTSRY